MIFSVVMTWKGVAVDIYWTKEVRNIVKISAIQKPLFHDIELSIHKLFPGRKTLSHWTWKRE
jgi:hypothetical protein